ncbi:MAG: zinc ribbon domain-containing protein [Deltaproteobacteria bacterium]|nr:zinc ribbon domain-containing protein [Deltaproteobacteria bacterium]
MKCPKCRAQVSEGREECPRCGVVFVRYREFLAEMKAESQVRNDNRAWSSFWGRLMPERVDVNPVSWALRALLLAVLLVLTALFVLAPVASNTAGSSWLHGVNLVFHEAGHIVFIPLGRTMTVLGGSLMQVLVPLVCCLVLLLRTEDAFGAVVGLWWAGESLLDVAPYVADGRVQQLMLLGGVTGRDVPGYHDWNVLLTQWGLLHQAEALGLGVHVFGAALCLLALVWGAAVLVREARDLWLD